MFFQPALNTQTSENSNKSSVAQFLISIGISIGYAGITFSESKRDALAVIVGADLGFVVVHHLTRLFLVITCAPLVVRLMKKLD